ncbi:ABC transporter ATP-binding protein [Paraconexibacter sp.]|uniref:ABC transporter ATP-binding protein n=1 Tax=Paraconexibacter sp. TaxID=2949640 RepID=UPI003562A406
MSAQDGPAPTTGASLALTDVAVVYSDVIHALRGVSIEVPAGSILALLGANGAGKTTVLRTVTGLLGMHRARMIRGDITLDGESVARRGAVDRVRAGVAQVMEGRRIFAPLTVDENLRAGSFSRARGERAAVAERRDHVLALFPDLAPRLDDIAGYLSGGQQQMLAIGRALMAGPRLLVLDEPSLGLAPLLVEQIRDAIVAINREGTTVLLVEQNARMALRIANRGVVLASGTVALEGDADALLDDPKIQASYLGGTIGETVPGAPAPDDHGSEASS